MWRSYSTVSFLLILWIWHCGYCDIQYSQEAVCPGVNVTVTCTIPAQIHHWSIPDLIARSLSVRDWNRTVADPPFLFNVTEVRREGSITVITASTAAVNFNEHLDGVDVSCWDGNEWPIEFQQKTTIMLKAPPPAPGTTSITFPSPRQLNFTWNVQNPDVDAYLVNISGPDDQCGSRDILHRSTENTYTCSGWSPTGQEYTLSVKAVNCGGKGPANDPVTVYLRSKKL